MPDKLPINLDALPRQRTVEGERIEYKGGWNPDAIIRMLCAFANDFQNLGGGYVVIGQDCDAHGQPVFPPVGLSANQLDKIQRELLACCQSIQPPYFPVLSMEVVEGRNLIAGPDGGPLDGHPEDPQGNGRQRLTAAGVRDGRRPNLVRHPAAASSASQEGSRYHRASYRGSWALAARHDG